MKSLKQRVIAQIECEHICEHEGDAETILNNMCNSYLLTRLSDELEEMFKERDDQIAFLNRLINIQRDRQY